LQQAIHGGAGWRWLAATEVGSGVLCGGVPLRRAALRGDFWGEDKVEEGGRREK
jgi:hypothetical protein